VQSEDVTVVDVDKVVEKGTTDEGPLYVCVGEDVNLEALPDRSWASFPEDQPTWQVLGKPQGSSPTLTPADGNTTTLGGLSLPGPYIVRAKCCNPIGDIIVVVAVDVDLAVSGLSDGDEEDPGLYINANWDDDDDDGWSPNDTPPGGSYTGDKSDSNIAGGDNDFRSCTLSISPSGVSGNVQLTFGSGIKVWETNTKVDGGGSSGVSSGSSFAVGDLPKTLYIEGASGSTSFKDVELKAEHTSTNAEDIVKITVFEVTLTGLFGYGDQQSDNDKKHSTVGGSSDKNGKISWDDANADGTKDDPDPNCMYFRSCMELQGTVKPGGVTNEVQFDFDRQKWSRLWYKLEGEEDWGPPDQSAVPWQPDDGGESDEDKTPSATDHIYHIDGPGYASKLRTASRDYVGYIGDRREWVKVYIDGNWYQCSDYYKWHVQWFTKPKNGTEMTRDSVGLQKLDSGWISVPDSP
jgi:hypothetical protein